MRLSAKTKSTDPLIRRLHKLENSLSQFNDAMMGGGYGHGNFYQGDGINQIAKPDVLIHGLNYLPLTLNRIALSYAYMTIGLVQTMIDQPVEDAFRDRIRINSEHLTKEENEEVIHALYNERDIESFKQAVKWSRLYGGSGLIIATDDNPSGEFNVEQIKQGDKLKFIPADRWELILQSLAADGVNWELPIIKETQGTTASSLVVGNNCEHPFNYYGIPLHRTRVMQFRGREAPSFVRVRLQGWGMSELERCIRSINSFIKFQDALFEFIDESKVDIFKIYGFTASMVNPADTKKVAMRVQMANKLKNYRRALVMDKEDDYEQKQIRFSGLADIMNEIRINVAADIRFPVNKLFGQSASGFSSGEDVLENYNSLIQSDVRSKCEVSLMEMIKCRMRALWGEEKDFTIEWPNLRVMNAEAEMNVKVRKQAMIIERLETNLLTPQEAELALAKEQLAIIESDVSKGKGEFDRMLVIDGQMARQEQMMLQMGENESITESGGTGKMGMGGMTRVNQFGKSHASQLHGTRTALRIGRPANPDRSDRENQIADNKYRHRTQ